MDMKQAVDSLLPTCLIWLTVAILTGVETCCLSVAILVKVSLRIVLCSQIYSKENELRNNFNYLWNAFSKKWVNQVKGLKTLMNWAFLNLHVLAMLLKYVIISYAYVAKTRLRVNSSGEKYVFVEYSEK